MTRAAALVLCLGVVVGALVSGSLRAADQAPALPPLAQCEVDRVALQSQVVELRARVVELQTALDRAALAAERTRIEGTLPTVEGQRWDWGTLRYVPVPAAK